MDGFSPDAFKYAVSLIKDGFVFEKFMLDYLSKILGYGFMPAGGIRDRGIDGLEHTFHRKELTRTIYQTSIEKDYKGKIKNTLDILKKNKIKYDQFVYVTNIQIPAKDLLIDELIQSYKSAITIYDLDWLANHVNDSDGTVRSFKIFVDSYLHEFNKPGKSYTVANLENDPRVYVFLRQQLEEKQSEQKLDEILADTLILYALEDTDPDKGIFLRRDEILERVRGLVKFDPVTLTKLIDGRLKVLSTKPRRIKHHRDIDTYCLGFEERLSIQNRNLNDVALFEGFLSDTKKNIETYSEDDLDFKSNALSLIMDLLHTLFYRQGIEFSDFVIHGASEDIVEKSLPDIVSEVIDRSQYIEGDKQKTKNGLLAIIRHIVYDGTKNQKEFLVRLSRTYMMLLLFQCDPNLCTYFGTLASKLRIYVCTSIIIPALSERFLEVGNRRYTNLLLGAKNAGVKLTFNEAILNEMVAHFRMIKNIYENEYKGREEVFTDELAVIYVREIMLRAFFYSRIRGQVDKFDEFIMKFVSPNLRGIQDDMVELLKSEFGMEYVTNSSLGIHLDQDEEIKIAKELSKHKGQVRAHTDAEVMLTIHALRDRDNELGNTGIFGYRTWWLSSDVTTQKAAIAAAGSKYARTCYMRPDFLYNYITLAPKKGEVEESFKNVFPTFLGVSLSWDLSLEVTNEIRKFLKEHKETSPSRIKGVIRQLIDDLKQKPENQTGEFIKSFFTEHFKE